MPKKVLDSIPGAYKTLDTLITSFDSVSAIEQTTGLTSLFENISKSVGDGAFAFALFFQNEEQFKSTGAIQFMGLFDTKKWLGNGLQKLLLKPHQVHQYHMRSLHKIVNESFKELNKQNINFFIFKSDKKYLNKKMY